MSFPVPPPPSQVFKKYQRGQKIVIEPPVLTTASISPPEWFRNNKNRQGNEEEVYTVVVRNGHQGLGIIEQIIERHSVPHNKVIVAFDIDRTLRVGGPDGLKPRDPNTKTIIENLSQKGATLYAITGAHADTNPVSTDATVVALNRIKPIGLDIYFMDQSMPYKEIIIRGDDWQVRHRGRVIVSMEKDVALDFLLCCISGSLDANGVLQHDKKPGLLIFVDDSDINVLSVFRRFKQSTLFSLPVVSVFFEPTMEMFIHNPTDGDNPKPGFIDEVYEYQINDFRINENVELIQAVYKAYTMELPKKFT